MDQNNIDWLSGAGPSLGGALGGFLGGFNNPAKKAMPYLNNIPGELHEAYDPWINRGRNAGDVLEGQYGNLLNDPGGLLNKIGGGYHQSPGFQFALQQALQGANHAAAAGGMIGSPQNQYQDMELATNLANQDYNSWIQNALGLYGHGLSGEQGFYNTGAQAGMNLGNNLSEIEALKAKLAYEAQNAENQHEGGFWGAIGGGLGSLAGGAISSFLGG